MHVPKLDVALALLIAVGLSAHALAAPFKWVDEKGRVVYGDRPPDDSARQLSGAGFASREPVLQQCRGRRKRVPKSFAHSPSDMFVIERFFGPRAVILMRVVKPQKALTSGILKNESVR